MEKVNNTSDINFGFDSKNMSKSLQTHQLTNLTKAGVLDPTKVVKNALLFGTSVASMLLTVDGALVNDNSVRRML
jgi:chaperonin GroEL (HSP60 family)